jgi:hypothetical protein
MGTLLIAVILGAAQSLTPSSATPTRDAVAEAHGLIASVNQTEVANATGRESQPPLASTTDAQAGTDVQRRRDDPNDVGKQELHRLFSEQAAFFNRTAPNRKPR